ncbi:TetR/AcrR family transcriptional regulator [Microbacterium sp. SORGH_AS_0888]|uniref:TetR/AcrR family transcriptional regulator n=1 Tax=Microbacterium sp. SORGH_AS_0888 TaxID=3041791 RepID=UPI002784F895|nr:TetR/AcrR family transcriptional regulator [Microbacterium sp. SORGH_AS_0888]MDQ1129470.1 AcrR family transcriptional regulator [Microbacterium sp. SORGH_AS_0888]
MAQGAEADDASRVDPRVVRTRTALQDALLALALARPLEEITVSDIVECAGVNRSSFYQHYADKDRLLSDALSRDLDEVAARVAERTGPPEFVAGVPAELVVYLEHIAANVELFRRVLGPHATSAGAESLRDRIVEVVGTAIAPTLPIAFEGVPREVVAAGIAGSVLAVVGEWLRHDPLEPVPAVAHWVWSVLTGLGVMRLRVESALTPEE